MAALQASCAANHTAGLPVDGPLGHPSGPLACLRLSPVVPCLRASQPAACAAAAGLLTAFEPKWLGWGITEQEQVFREVEAGQRRDGTQPGAHLRLALERFT